MTIFYFTGTGNALWAARTIAEAVGAALVSIPSVIGEQREYTDDAVGFVYPQYAVGLPKMVRKFIIQNTFAADYIFAVDLYAHIRMGALGEIAGLLPINYGVYLKTPWNFIFALNAPKHPETVLKTAESKLARVIEDITSRRDQRARPSKRVGGATKYFRDGKFKVADSCTKCGICAGVCPARNVELRTDPGGGKPIFGSSCEICYACVNHCPSHAIYSNNAMMKRRRYRNPYVALGDIMAANSGMGVSFISAFDIRPIDEVLRPMVTDFISEHWFGTDMLIRGEVIDMTKVDGFALLEKGVLTGVITYITCGSVCEITSLDSTVERRGVGTRLVNAVVARARELDCKRVQLLTTNDNLNAIGFYQKRGFELVGVNLGAIDKERALKPSIPFIGQNGIPIRHEVEFAMYLS